MIICTKCTTQFSSFHLSYKMHDDSKWVSKKKEDEMKIIRRFLVEKFGSSIRLLRCDMCILNENTKVCSFNFLFLFQCFFCVLVFLYTLCYCFFSFFFSFYFWSLYFLNAFNSTKIAEEFFRQSNELHLPHDWIVRLLFTFRLTITANTFGPTLNHSNSLQKKIPLTTTTTTTATENHRHHIGWIAQVKIKHEMSAREKEAKNFIFYSMLCDRWRYHPLKTTLERQWQRVRSCHEWRIRDDRNYRNNNNNKKQNNK